MVLVMGGNGLSQAGTVERSGTAARQPEVTQVALASTWGPTASKGADGADCVRLPGNISSLLFLKAHNFQSDISPDDFKQHFNQQLKPTSYIHLTNPT